MPVAVAPTGGRVERERLLVVEDEQKVAAAVREGLQSEGYDVTVEMTGEAAFFRINTEPFELILLDLGLPGRDGLDILRAMREAGVATPVLVLTARDTVGDRVQGLNSGADDYLVKPFAFAELLARIQAVLRRGRSAEPQRLAIGDLEIETATRTVTRGGEAVDLTVKEFDLLVYLARHARHVVSRDTLVREVWRETAASTTLNNIIDVHVSRLRRKIDREGSVKLIHTVRGVGFVVREEEP
ncbi:MAG: response regulator transcription factor [Acidobacteria bacterium]|nr:response regulator transcription factor [Acidobacteriota bacterium]MYI74523.1 response regulator transcription factor [Acidobacteriota bacterium]